MYLIEQYAHTNNLRQVHPAEKLAYAMTTLIIAVFFNLPLLHLTIFTLMAFSTLYLAGVQSRHYRMMLLLPIAFILLGIPAIIINFSKADAGYLASIQIFGIYAGITADGLATGIALLTKSMAAISALYFLTFTTPIVDVIACLRRLHVPDLLIELMGLVYKSIFVMTDAAVSIHMSQASRLGYGGFKRSIKSLSTLAVMLFAKAYDQGQKQYVAMLSRGYGDKIRILEMPYEKNNKIRLAILLVEILLLLSGLLLGGYFR